MAGLRIAEILLEEKPNKYWEMLREIGVSETVGVLPRGFNDWRKVKNQEPWDFLPLLKYKNMLKENGFKLVAIEDNPPMDKIRLGLDERDYEIENISKMLDNFGKLGIKLWSYSWNAITGWTRTSTHIKSEYGTVSGFDLQELRDVKSHYKYKIKKEDLWNNLKYFLDKVIPIAENNDIQICMHPDDPPLNSLMGIPRIMNSIESFDKLIELNKSPNNGMTFCQGNFTLMTDNLPAAIKHFGDRIKFVHFRDVLGNREKFMEVPLGKGKTPLADCIRSYNDINFSGIMRVDHVPTLCGDDTDVPGYSYLGRLYAIGYINGLYDAYKNNIH